MNRFKNYLLIVLLICISQESYCWGFFGHKHINYHAVFLLPPELISFYKSNIQYLADHAVDPDKRRYAIPEEGPRHYIDMDKYGVAPFTNLPKRWNDAVARYSEDSLQAHGIAPWWINIMHQRLKKAFEEKNAEAILKLSADIGHYIADVHVPLHTSSNHNGQKTGQTGIHGFWESRLPELYAHEKYDLVIGKAEFIEQPLDFIWDRIYESAAATDSVLLFEKELGNSMQSDQRFAFEERNGKVVKQYASSYSALYHKKLNGMVERRMRSSIFSVASFWYTAWVEAGQPDLRKMGRLLGTPESLKNLDALQSAWLGGKIIGRSCSN